MEHKFTYKLIDQIDPHLLTDLKKLVTSGPFRASNDFDENTITIRSIVDPEPAFIDLLDFYMYRLFSPDGHIETNVAKMVPGGYVPEHSDFDANTYGPNQDSIIKFQIPIITNPGAGLMWRWSKERQRPAEALFLQEGGIYMFDNTRVHCSVNLGTTDRYWLTSRWKAECLFNKSLLA
jgi:hypothetical protein